MAFHQEISLNEAEVVDEVLVLRILNRQASSNQMA